MSTKAGTSVEDLDAILIDYVSGTLDELHELLVASYLTLCPEAHQRVQDCEKLGGLLMEHFCEPVEMDCQSLEVVLGRLDEAESTDPCAAFQEEGGNPYDLSLPKPVCRFLAERGHHPSHWKTVWPGVRMLDLSKQGRACLVNMEPNASPPRHKHKEEELCLVLEGVLMDESGNYHKGNILHIQAKTSHTQKAGPEGGCLYLTISNAPLYNKWLSDVLTIFFR